MHYGATILALVLLTISLVFSGASSEAPSSQVRSVVITPQQRTHILYGDETGGGHFHAADKPCKSKFPVSWSEDKIIETIEMIAANDNLEWISQRNSHQVAEQQVGHLKIRVVMDHARKNVITGYPVNVPRNRCAANDNQRGAGK